MITGSCSKLPATRKHVPRQACAAFFHAAQRSHDMKYQNWQQNGSAGIGGHCCPTPGDGSLLLTGSLTHVPRIDALAARERRELDT